MSPISLRNLTPILVAALLTSACGQELVPDVVRHGPAAGEEDLPRQQPLARASDGAYTLTVAPHLGDLDRRIVADYPMVLVPTASWHPREDGSGWLMTGTGTFVCHVSRPVASLRLELVPSAGSTSDGFATMAVYWDRVPLPAGLRHEEGRLLLDLAPDLLTPGTHLLTIELHSPPAQGEEPVARFAVLRYELEGSSFELAPDRAPRWNYMADLLSRGVTGSNDRLKLGGALFIGPQRLRLELDPALGNGPDGGFDRERQVTSWVQNSSHRPARFEIRHPGGSAEVSLEPHERHVLSTTLPAGSSELTLVTEGMVGGLFLWGAIGVYDAPGATRPTEEPTPIVLVTLDTTRRDVLGPYGGNPKATPSLSRFAATATVYERAYSTAPWTLPSHASIFTGLYPSHHRAGAGADHLAQDQTTLAERLRRKGYVTLGFAGGTLSSYLYGVGQGFGVYWDPDGFETTGDLLTDRIAETLDHYAGASPFLFVNYFDPHYPYVGHDGQAEAPAGLPEPWPAVLAGDGQAYRGVVTGSKAIAPDALEPLRRLYEGEVAFVDRQLGRLFDLLEAHGLFDRALVVVAADHGELLGERGYFSHSGRLDPELLAVPLLVKWPEQREGERTGELVSLADLFPTLLAAAGLEPVAGIDGIDLRDRAGQLARRRTVISEEHDTPFHPVFPNMRLGANAWAVQGRSARNVVWEDPAGAECQRFVDEGWQIESCGRILSAEDVRARLGVEAPAGEDRRILSPQEKDNLRALGYL